MSELISAEEMRQKTAENAEDRIHHYFQRYRDHLMKKINERSLEGFYNYIYIPNIDVGFAQTALELVCEQFKEAGYHIEKTYTGYYGDSHIDKIVIRWN